jgi:hypothetical protein
MSVHNCINYPEYNTMSGARIYPWHVPTGLHYRNCIDLQKRRFGQYITGYNVKLVIQKSRLSHDYDGKLMSHHYLQVVEQYIFIKKQWPCNLLPTSSKFVENNTKQLMSFINEIIIFEELCHVHLKPQPVYILAILCGLTKTFDVINHDILIHYTIIINVYLVLLMTL